jgi:hypothetical protein
MRKKLFISSVSFLALVMLLSFSSKVFAMTPTLSLTGTGDGDSVQINVTGDPNASVLFFYIKNGSSQRQIVSLGTTNTVGTLTTTISSSSYGIVAGSPVYVTTGGISSTQYSPSVVWPTVASTLSSSNMLSLSQTGLVLILGQSATLTASNLNSSSLYQASNSNPQIANFSISGSQITVTANSYGTTTGTFCLISNTSNCGSVYVIVQNSNAQPLTFNQSSVSISPGQTIAVQISGGSGAYSVINNSSQNNGVVQTNISGGTITLTTTSTSGSSSITVCTTDMSSCGIINVTIGNASYSAVSFSQSNPTVTVGQSLNISIFGPTNSFFYVASNSNPSIVQPNISGSTLTLLGITNGSSVLSICASSNNCGSLTVTVNFNSTNGGNLMLSQDNVTLSIGQTQSITISGGSMPYNVVPNSNNIFQSTLNSNMLTLYGVSSGLSLANVCSSNGSCLTLSVSVNGSINNITTPIIPSDCTGALYSASTGTACPASTINIQNTTVAPTPVPIYTPSAVFKFTKTLKLNSTGAEVLQLQKKLKTLGFYKGKIDGGFGSSTEKAVKAFQKAHKLSQVGSVGPQTRALLNS